MLFFRDRSGDLPLSRLQVVAILLWLGGLVLAALSFQEYFPDPEGHLKAKTDTCHIVVFILPEGASWRLATSYLYDDPPPVPALDTPLDAAIQCTITVHSEQYFKLWRRSVAGYLCLRRLAVLEAQSLSPSIDQTTAEAVVRGMQWEIAAAVQSAYPKRQLERCVTAAGEDVHSIRWRNVVGEATFLIAIVGTLAIACFPRICSHRDHDD